MASHSSSRTLGKEPRPIHIGEKVARLFQSHELTKGERAQWVQGKVAASKLVLKKGTKSQQQTW